LKHTECVTIDGPVASGKTTIGKELAKRIKYHFLDTGIMYRAVTYLALKKQINPNNEDLLMQSIKNLNFIFIPNSTEYEINLDNKTITQHLKNPEIEKHVSTIATNSLVRSELVKIQREIAFSNHIVMVGRDIGTIVIPNAKNKFFLLASSQTRAQRRYKDFKKQGINLSLELVKSEIENRDKIDTQRKESPLEPAHDSIQINSDDMNIDEVIELMLNNIEKNK